MNNSTIFLYVTPLFFLIFAGIYENLGNVC